MIISKILINNFRSIESAEIVPKSFNVLVGQNNHGKTNIFEAIEWFYSGAGDLAKIAHMRKLDPDISVEIEYTGIQKGIETIKNQTTKESFKKFANGRDVIRVIRRKSDAAKRLLWDEEKMEWTQKNFAGFDKAFNDCIPRLQYVSTDTKVADIAKYGKKTPIGEMLSSVLSVILEKSQNYQKFRDIFNKMFTDDESEVRKELNNLSQQVKNNLGTQFPECSKVTFEIAEPLFEDLLKNFETSINDGIETKLDEKGDGMQRALMLAIIKTYSDYRRENDGLGKKFLFLIDEAELHLHPTAQRQLKESLLLLAENGDQIFINTHSSVLLAEEHSKQCLFKIEKLNYATNVSVIKEMDKPQVVFELLGGSPSDLLFPNNFIIVEGRSEYEFLTKVINKFYPSNPKLQIIFARGDLEKQKKSMDAINNIFIPLYKTPVYKDRLIILCDKPNEVQKENYNKFVTDHPDLLQKNQLVLLDTNSLEEYYPQLWKKTSEEVKNMKSQEKTDLAKMAGENITKETFESEMPTVFKALSLAWENAHK